MTNWNQFLECNYHILSLNLRPSDFFSWLRAKQVLTHSDQEEVLNKYHTTVEQMGLLVDIIKRKGEKGFKAFMEVVEYSYPEVFSSITGELPRDPPPEYKPNFRQPKLASNRARQRPMSIEILGLMGDLVQTLSVAHIGRKEELGKLQNYVIEMQENICREKAQIYLQLKCANEMVHALENENAELAGKLEKYRTELGEKSDDLEKLRSLKDKYMEESSNLCKLNADLNSKIQKLEESHQLLSKKFSSGSVHSSSEDHPECVARGVMNGELESSQISTITKQLAEAKKANLVFSFEKAQLESRIKDLQNKNKDLDQNICKLSTSFNEVKNERDQMISQKKELQNELSIERESCRKLETDYHNHRNKYTYMESKMSKLQEQLEQFRSSQTGNISPTISTTEVGVTQLNPNPVAQLNPNSTMQLSPNPSNRVVRRHSPCRRVKLPALDISEHLAVTPPTNVD